MNTEAKSFDFLGKVPQNAVSAPKKRELSREEWIQRKKDRQNALRKQTEGLESATIFKLSVEAKLVEAGAEKWCNEHLEPSRPNGEMRPQKWFQNFLSCGVELRYIMCPICGAGHEAPYQCNLKWCPRCNWRIIEDRKKLLEGVTKGMTRVKHVVLTQKNFEHLTREKIRESTANLMRLRKQEIFGKVSGGAASLEFTNEERGWHMHWHILLQSSFINNSELAIAWGKLVGQEYAIVKVMAVDDLSYLKEVCKYIVTGSELAKWKPEQILEFVTALRRTRCFIPFGKFREIARFQKAFMKETRKGFQCESCGEGDVVVGNDRMHCKRIASKKGY